MKPFLFITTTIAWFGLIVQLWLTLHNGIPFPENVIRYFSYFTVLTNGMVAVVSSAVLFFSASAFGRWTKRPSTQTPVVVYISIVGVIFNLLLRSAWHTEGWQWLINEILHVITPMLWVLYWVLFVPKQQLQWKHSWHWLLYPLLYTICILLRGAASGFYPYFFIDAGTLGWGKAIINALFVGAAFWVVGLIYISIGKLTTRKVFL